MNNQGAAPGAAMVVGETGGLVVRRHGFTARPERLWSRIDARIHNRLSVVHVAAAASAVVLGTEFLRPAAYKAPGLRAAIETVMTLLALAAAWLVGRQSIQSRRVRDLVLLGAILTFGAMHFWSYALPSGMDMRTSSSFVATALMGELFLAAIFVTAALAPAERLVPDPRRAVVITAALSLAAVALAAVFGLLLRDELVANSPHAAQGVDVAWRQPLAVIVTLAATGLFAGAAIAFARRDRSEHDGLSLIPAGAAVLLAAACLSGLALPLVPPDHIALPDGLRLAAFALLLLVAARGELALRTGLAREASIAERRRVARDLHDGLAQDLAFIAAQGDRMARELGTEHPVVIAARRALEISRDKIAELSDPPGATLRVALQTVAKELSDRFEIGITVDADRDLELVPEVCENVSRITREAVTNAARHGGAKNVRLSLNRSNGVVTLRVCDDGCGIDEARQRRGAAREGFGLRSMHERALAVGGQMTVRQAGTAGTELEVVLR